MDAKINLSPITMNKRPDALIEGLERLCAKDRYDEAQALSNARH